jgi:hypothetical protein
VLHTHSQHTHDNDKPHTRDNDKPHTQKKVTNKKVTKKMNPSCESCSICMEVLCHTSQQPVTLTTCNHEFHTTCLEQWTNNFSNTSCPLCRAQIVTSPSSSSSSSPTRLTRYQLEEEIRSNAFVAARRAIRQEFRFF